MTRAIRGFEWTLRRREAAKDMLSLKQQMQISVLIVLLLTSAFSVIYLKDLSRRLFIRYQHLQQVQQQHEIEWSKLLLEEGAWSSQARVQYVASTQLHMMTPQMKDIVMVEVPK